MNARPSRFTLDPFWNALLAAQVALSLVLTGLVMLSPLGAGLQAQTPEVHRPPAPSPVIPDTFAPWQLWVGAGNGPYSVLTAGDPEYASLWRTVRAALQAALSLSPGTSAVTAEELAAAAGGRVVGGDLPVPLTVENWAWGWNAARRSADAAVYDRVVVALDGDPAVYLLGPGGYRAFPLPGPERVYLGLELAGLPLQNYRTLRPLAGEPVPVARSEPWRMFLPGGPVLDLGDPETPLVDPWVLVPAGRPYASVPILKAEEANAWAMVGRLFPDQSVVREVQERDGARIFLDGQRALRIYEQGAIEFTQPPPPDGRTPDFASAVEVTAAFLAAHHLWYDQARLVNHQPFEGGYYLAYGTQGPQLPLVSRKPLLEVVVTGDRVTYLQRWPAYIAGTTPAPEPLLSAEAAIRAVPDHLLWGLVRVRGMRLAHLVSPAPAVVPTPVWVITLSGDGGPLLMDARTGVLIR